MKETDVKHVVGGFGDDYKRMMGQHWSDIEESLQGSKEKAPGGSAKKRQARSVTRSHGAGGQGHR